MMLSRLGVPEALVPPVFLTPSPHRHFLHRANAVAGPALVVLMITGHASARTIREFEEQGLSLTSSGEYTERLWVEKERERVHGPGPLPLLGFEGGVSRFSWIHSLLANLKHKSRN